MSRAAFALCLALAVGCASTHHDYPDGAPEADVALMRASCIGGASVDVGPVEVSSDSYPCTILRTYAAMEATEGRGWLLGALPRFFLKVRLVTKGIFSMFAGLVGLG